MNYANSRSREISKEIKGAELIIESIGDAVDARPSDEDLERMRFAVADAREILNVSINQAKGGLTQEDKDSKIAEALQKKQAWADYKQDAEFLFVT